MSHLLCPRASCTASTRFNSWFAQGALLVHEVNGSSIRGIVGPEANAVRSCQDNTARERYQDNDSPFNQHVGNRPFGAAPGPDAATILMTLSLMIETQQPP